MQNKSFTYILPLFCKYLYQRNSELENILFVTFVKDCYCFHKVNDKIKQQFTIKLDKPKKYNEIFQKYLSNLKKNIIFADQITTEDEQIIIFNIPEEISDTYNKFISGKYSEIDSKDKITILTFCKKHISPTFSMEINRIFSKNKERRRELEEKLGMKLPKDLELSSVPEKLSETFKL